MNAPLEKPAGSVGKRIIIVGAGGQALIASHIAGSHNFSLSCDSVIGMVDDDPTLAGTFVAGQRVLGPIASLGLVPHDAIIVAIGDNTTRRRLTEMLCAQNEVLTALIHPAATVADGVRIGAGSMISVGAVVLPQVSVGRGVILNTKCSVDHDSVVGDYVHIGPGATIGGRCSVGDGTLVSIGATVASGVRIGRNCVIGAGAVVLDDIPDGVRAWGVPARIIT